MMARRMGASPFRLGWIVDMGSLEIELDNKGGGFTQHKKTMTDNDGPQPMPLGKRSYENKKFKVTGKQMSRTEETKRRHVSKELDEEQEVVSLPLVPLHKQSYYLLSFLLMQTKC
ncbi:hypothetical protein RJT34_31813 [Clitoria ternatea]|uniref:Uncharacterized protein n=1 Tax=Clitoria ternatea TaxID=43366 RepID=A0AAN9EWJ0_CLITE